MNRRKRRQGILPKANLIVFVMSVASVEEGTYKLEVSGNQKGALFCVGG